MGTLAIFNNAKIPLAILASALVFGTRWTGSGWPPAAW